MFLESCGKNAKDSFPQGNINSELKKAYILYMNLAWDRTNEKSQASIGRLSTCMTTNKKTHFYFYLIFGISIIIVAHIM
jgi:hypothetical protein